ncbi:NADP-dependent oxidoreductase [Polymorphobacter glacialis]|uniref:NADP-dependent oxidoreductase n=1 Tax=Sandarakinorhabdus glacialis TaxID=1614636 RepID=A0A917ECE6_9SPHN|nr:NADP-dependent oxidoreductase [Polymorphobacter glacialis]GGE19214.1 NADP-dependent oxidoreductase [Polymorphobacter glacialis]
MTERNVWRLAKRPVGDIADGDLVYAAEAVPALEEGQFALRVIYLSLDPTNRIWMSDQEQYMPPVVVGAAMRGGVCGRVIESRRDGVAVGDLYAGLGEWADVMVTDGTGMGQLPEIPGVPLAAAFGTLGLVGPTAYFGLLDIGQPKAGETLVVGAAAGGVGQIVGQIGKIMGCKVIGIAGGKAKCDYVVNELGFDACIDYKSQDVGAELDRLAPEGVDINFEQVGGDIMVQVLKRMKLFGRMPLCGLISQYNDVDGADEPGFWTMMLMRRLSVRGFIVTDFAARFGESGQALLGWMLEGKLKTRQDIRPGLANAASAVKELYSGGNFGKLLVEVTPP